MGEPGPGEALVRQTAIGLNFIDTYFRSGLYPPPSGCRSRRATRARAWSRRWATGVTEVKVGQRVAYAASLGAYAERAADAGQACWCRCPRAISDEQAAAMMLKGMTAQYLLRQTYVVKPGDTILFHAAAGGVGLIAVPVGEASGRHGDRHGRQRGQGRARQGARLRPRRSSTSRRTSSQRVARSPAGKGVPVVYDGVGKATFMKLARLPARRAG